MRQLLSRVPGLRPMYRLVRRVLVPERPDAAVKAAGDFIRSKRGGFFIQIGSNDGVTGDPIHQHVVSRRWRGLVVEPLDDLYQRLCETYADVPRVRPIRAAVGTERGAITLYRVSGADPDDPPWADQLASFDRDVVLRHVDAVPRLTERVVEVSVPCLTWSDLDAEADATIDLLHVDTEGYDLQVLRQVEWHRDDAPTAVLYEHKHLSGSDRDEAHALLRRAGYELVIGYYDTYAERSR